MAYETIYACFLLLGLRQIIKSKFGHKGDWLYIQVENVVLFLALTM